MRIELTGMLYQLHKFILESFIRTGSSPTLTEIKLKFALVDEASAEKILAQLEATKAIHRAPGDVLVTHAYPFSNEPTHHRVRLASGSEVYSMCAVDALGIPLMTRQDANIFSNCNYCSRPVSVVVENGRISAFEPRELVVGYLKKTGEECISATDRCPHINFFCSHTHLSHWNSKNLDRVVQSLDLESAFESRRASFGSLLYEN